MTLNENNKSIVVIDGVETTLNNLQNAVVVITEEISKYDVEKDCDKIAERTLVLDDFESKVAEAKNLGAITIEEFQGVTEIITEN